MAHGSGLNEVIIVITFCKLQHSLCRGFGHSLGRFDLLQCPVKSQRSCKETPDKRQCRTSLVPSRHDISTSASNEKMGSSTELDENLKTMLNV